MTVFVTVRDIIGLVLVVLFFAVCFAVVIFNYLHRRRRHRATRDIPPARGQCWDWNGHRLYVNSVGLRISVEITGNTMISGHNSFTREQWRREVDKRRAFLLSEERAT